MPLKDNEKFNERYKGWEGFILNPRNALAFLWITISSTDKKRTAG